MKKRNSTAVFPEGRKREREMGVVIVVWERGQNSERTFGGMSCSVRHDPKNGACSKGEEGLGTPQMSVSFPTPSSPLDPDL